jgi:isopentenyl-diphosphate delta-isomerase
LNKKKSVDSTSSRKEDHIDICCNYAEKIQMNQTTGFENVHLIHKALPEINFDEIDLTTSFLNHEFKYPIFISAITGGTVKTEKINQKLAKMAEQFGIGMSVGSQRVALEEGKRKEAFLDLRKIAPTAFLASNLGAVQLNNDYNYKHIQEIADMISANAAVLHLNPLQEVIQPEGDTNFKELLPKIKKLSKKVKQPLIVKEVGAGISYELAGELIEHNVAAIDIAGAGGTSWSKIEAIRAKQQNYPIKSKVGELFKDWGIPTAVSTIEIGSKMPDLEFIASGGIRNGLQAAKALTFGAKLVGIAFPLACLASTSTEKQLLDWLEQFIYELKTAMFLVGASTIEDLQLAPLVVIGKTAQWLEARGILSKDDLIRG